MPKTEVKVIQTLDPEPPTKEGIPRWTVYFTDGSRAVTKRGAALNKNLSHPDNVAPNLVQVTYDRGQIIKVEPVRT